MVGGREAVAVRELPRREARGGLLAEGRPAIGGEASEGGRRQPLGEAVGGERAELGAQLGERRLVLGRPTECVGRARELALLQAAFDECVEEEEAALVASLR